MMAALGVVFPSAAARSRSISVRDSPAPNAPIFRKFRREIPSQNCFLGPQIVNIARSPLGSNRGHGRPVNGTLQSVAGATRFLLRPELGAKRKLRGWYIRTSPADAGGSLRASLTR